MAYREARQERQGPKTTRHRPPSRQRQGQARTTRSEGGEEKRPSPQGAAPVHKAMACERSKPPRGPCDGEHSRPPLCPPAAAPRHIIPYPLRRQEDEPQEKSRRLTRSKHPRAPTPRPAKPSRRKMVSYGTALLNAAVAGQTPPGAMRQRRRKLPVGSNLKSWIWPKILCETGIASISKSRQA